MMDTLKLELHDAEERLLEELRGLRKRLRTATGGEKPASDLTLGQRVADQVAATMGLTVLASAGMAMWGLLADLGLLPAR